MKERFLIGVVIGLGLLSVMVDFVSTILSVFSDAMLLGGAGYAGWLLLRLQRERSSVLKQENARLLAESRRLSTQLMHLNGVVHDA